MSSSDISEKNNVSHGARPEGPVSPRAESNPPALGVLALSPFLCSARANSTKVALNDHRMNLRYRYIENCDHTIEKPSRVMKQPKMNQLRERQAIRGTKGCIERLRNESEITIYRKL